MIREHAVLLKCLLLFIVFFVLQILLVLLFHYFFAETAVNELMMLAIDISFLICVLVGFKYFKSNNFQTTTYKFNGLLFCSLVVLSFLWFLISPLFKMYQEQWSLNVGFNTQNWNEITTNPTFFKVYGLLRLLLIVPILEELFYRKIILSSLLHKYGVYISIIVSSVLFSIGHLDFNNSFIFLIYGILLGITYWKANNIYYSILLHIFINFLTVFFI